MIRKPKKRAEPAEPGPTAAAVPAGTLTQAKSDFTAEGSPPPGQVSGADPVPASNETASPPSGAPSKDATPGRRQPPSPAGPVRRASKRNPAAWRGNG